MARAAWERALSIFDDMHHPDACYLRVKLDELAAPRELFDLS